MPTSQEIRDQYLSNQLFLMGEKFGGYEVIDRRSNYIVVVDATGADKKMFLDEAYKLMEAYDRDAVYGKKTPDELRKEAEGYQHDNWNPGEAGYAESKDLEWSYEPHYPLHRIATRGGVVETPEQWAGWFHNECKGHEQDGRPGYYDTMLDRHIQEPVVVHDNGEHGYVWDGHHRVGAQHVKGETTVPAIVGRKKIVAENEQKGVSFSRFSEVLNEGVFTYKGFRGTNISKNRECEGVFMELAEECEDPWALLSAVRAVDAFLEHRTAGTLDRARIAVSRVDDLANHPWLHEGTQEYLDGMVAAMKKARDHEEAMRLGNEFDKRIRGEGKHLFVSPEHADLPEKIAKKAQELSIQHGGDYSGHVLAAAMSFGFPAATMTENKSIFTIQPAIEVLDEDLDFAIEEKLTYNGFRVVLTEAFEHDVGRALSKLEKNPSLLDELASSLRSINDIAHHYDQHSVHMKESTLDEDWAGKSLAGGLIALNVAAAGLAGYTGHEQYKEHSFRTRLEKTAPADYTEYKKHNDAYYSQLVVAGKATYNKDPELAKKSQAAMDAIKAKHKELTESSEDKAIEHAEKTKRITLRKISSGPQVIKIAKRAAVELIAQKLAGKPVKKISKKEKNVIVDAIKKKKGVVMKLVKKLVPKIRAIEASSAEHEHESEDRGSQEFGSAGS